MRAGFLAGTALIIGIVIGTFVVAPLLRQEEPRSAAPAARTAPVAADPFEALRAKGNEAMDAQRCDEAIAAYDRALAIRFDADVATDRGVCLRQMGKREDALAAFELIMLRSPSHWQARYNLTAMLLELGRIDDARHSFAILKRQRPNDEAVKKLEQALLAAPPR